MSLSESEALIHLHARALACHCECLALNAANMFAICRNETPPYDEATYSTVMWKWGLVDAKGEPTFKI